MMPKTAYPLTWPLGWPRLTRPQPSQFKVSQDKAQRGLMRELGLLGATAVVISTNVPVRADGLPYSKFRQPDDQGVAVYFTRDGREQCIPCDKWQTVRENMRAIELTVNALRSLDRYGAKETVDAAFRGFAALPAHASSGTPIVPEQPWYDVLQVSPNASADVVRAAYRQVLASAHPDRGGTLEQFEAVQRAYSQASER